MKRYIVHIERKEYGFIELEANNKQEAEELAYEEMEAGNVNWGNEETKITEISKI